MSTTDTLSSLRRKLSNLSSSQIPFAISTAINKTLYDLKAKETIEMRSTLKNPTPFTLKGIVYEKSTKTNLKGTLAISPIQNEYLTFTIDAGTRIAKNKSIAVPVDKKILNSSKDIPRSKITKMLNSKKKYFNAKRGSSTLLPGIYENTKIKGSGKGKKAKSRLHLLLVWKDKTTYTKKPFQFDAVANKFVKDNFPVNLDAGINRALTTMR